VSARISPPCSRQGGAGQCLSSLGRENGSYFHILIVLSNSRLPLAFGLAAACPIALHPCRDLLAFLGAHRLPAAALSRHWQLPASVSLQLFQSGDHLCYPFSFGAELLEGSSQLHGYAPTSNRNPLDLIERDLSFSAACARADGVRGCLALLCRLYLPGAPLF
jgi:hypothetical protein